MLVLSGLLHNQEAMVLSFYHRLRFLEPPPRGPLERAGLGEAGTLGFARTSIPHPVRAFHGQDLRPSRPMTTAPTPPRARRGWRPCAPNWRSAGWTVSVVPHSDAASGRISARQCRAAGLADLLHRLGRRGGGAEGQGRDLCRWPLHACRCAPRPTRRCSSRAIWWRKDRKAGFPIICPGRQAGLTIPGCTPPMAWHVCASAVEKAGGTLVACDTNPHRRGVERPARAARQRQAMPHALNLAGEDEQGQTRPRWREALKKARRRCGGDHAVRFRLLAVQHPRPRRAAHALRAGLRHPACRWQRRSVPGRGQAQRRNCIAHLGNGVRLQAGRRFHRRAGCAEGQDRAGRSFHRRGRDLRPAEQGRRQGQAGARSLPAAQGLQESAGNRRHAQGPYPRRRGAVALSLPGSRARRPTAP